MYVGCVCACVFAAWARISVRELVPAVNKFRFCSKRFSGFLSLLLLLDFLFVCLTILLCESVQIIVCLCTIGPGSRLACVSLMLLRICCSCRVCENGWKVCAYFCVRTCDSRWRMGRQDGAGDDEWGDRQRRIALYPSVTIPLSLSLSSLSLPVGMMQCLLFCGSEEEKDGGKMGRRWKEKNCIHPQSMFTSVPFLPPLLPSFPIFAATLLPFPSPLFLPLLHPRLCIPPLCWSESVVSIVSFGVIQLQLLLFFAVSHCFFFTILISKEFLPPRYAFSYLISGCTHLPQHIFLWVYKLHSFR